MIIPIELRFRADKGSKSAFRTDKTIKSHDVNSVEFHISIDGLELTDNHTAKILSIFHSSKSQVNVNCEIVEGKIIYKPDTNLISRHEHVTNYVYVYNGNQSLDVREFIYTVDLSKIDETSLEVKEVYDQSYADLLADFERALSDYKDNLPQADSVRADIDEVLNQFGVDSQKVIGDLVEVSATAEIAEASRVQAESERVQAEQARKEAETLREDNYEQLIDTALIEADVVGKVDNKVTELTPKINNLTAQLAQTDGRIDNLIALPEGSTTNDARLEDIKIGADGNTYDSPANAVRSQFSDVNYQLNNIAYKLGDVVSIANGYDVASHNGTVSSFNSGDLIIDPDASTRAWRWIVFKDDSDRVEFEYTGTQYLLLYEKDSKAVAVSLKNGNIIEFQPDSIVNINKLSSPEVMQGDIVRATKDFVPENNRYNYIIEVKRVGSSSFEVWEDSISSKINYSTYIDGKNKTFGFVMYPSNVQNTVNNMKVIKHSEDSIEAKLEDLEDKIVYSVGRHTGKSLATIGDSMTMAEKYQPKIVSELGLSGHTNFGANGYSTVDMVPLKGWWGSANKSELIVFFMGTNDFGQERDLGEIDSTDLNTTSGAVRSIMEEFSLPKFHGRTKLIVLSPQRWGYTSGTPVNSTMTNTKGITLWQYLDRIKTIAQEFGFPVLDLYHNLGVNKNNASYFMYDGLHPTDETYERIGYMIAKKIETLW